MDFREKIADEIFEHISCYAPLLPYCGLQLSKLSDPAQYIYYHYYHPTIFFVAEFKVFPPGFWSFRHIDDHPGPPDGIFWERVEEGLGALQKLQEERNKMYHEKINQKISSRK